MKRHPQLQPLSRQHHNGLLMALLLSKGLRKNADATVMNDFISNGWDMELNEHFRMEEELIIPAATKYALEESLSKQLLEEHSELRELVNLSKSKSATNTQIARFAELLEKHIRFEERVYFPKLEELLPANLLEEIGSKLHDDTTINCMNYPVKFWE